MSEKPSRPRIVPLRRVTGKPVTDPAELEALQEMVRSHRSAGQPLGVRTRGGVSPTDSFSQAEQLAEQVAGWSSQEQAVFLAGLLDRLSPDVLRFLAEAVRGRLGE